MKKGIGSRLWKQRQLFLILLPGLLFFLIFRYGPMYGLVIAFQKFNPFLGITGSPWVGLENFQRLFAARDIRRLLFNTLRLGLLQATVVFVAPIIFSLLLNEVRHMRWKKFYQTVSYLPSFLSIVIICSIFIDLFSVHGGLINRIITAFGKTAVHFNGRSEYYVPIYILSDIWAGLGSGAIIYLAALSGVDQNLYEAAAIDGCSRLKMMRHITIPSIKPTILTMFLLSIGNVIRIAPDKTLLLYNDLVLKEADILSAYVYRIGLLNTNYSFASAVGLLESVVASVILFIANKLCKQATGTGLW